MASTKMVSSLLFSPRSLRVMKEMRHIHTSTSYKAPFVWLMAPVTRLLVAVGGRIGRSVWGRLSPEKKVKARKYLYGAGGILVGGGVVYYCTHLEYLSLTQRYRFMMYTRDEVCQLLKQELNEGNEDDRLNLQPLLGDQQRLLPTSHRYYKTILSVMSQIRDHNTWCNRMSDIKWRLTIVDNDEVTNAVSLPTGDIIVYTGMIKACHNIDELGLLLSHEMSHVILDHGVEGLSHKGLTSFITLLFIGAVWFIIPSDIFSLFLHGTFNSVVTVLTSNKHSRKLELEADQFGFLLASKACFNPEKAIILWQHLPMYNETDTILEYFENHPCNARRYLYLDALLPYATTLYKSSECEDMRKEMKSFTKTILKTLKFIP